MLPTLLGVPGKLYTILQRIPATMPTILAYLDASVSGSARQSDGYSAALATHLAALQPATGATEYTTGSGTFTVPTGVTMIYLTMTGGGASGSARTGTSDAYGGSASGALIRWPIKVTSGQNIAYAVGAGGAATTLTIGIAGGDSTFGTLTVPGAASGIDAGGWTPDAKSLTSNQHAFFLPGGDGGFSAVRIDAGEYVNPLYEGGAGATTGGGGYAGGGGSSFFGAGGDAACASGDATASAGGIGAGGGGAVSVGGVATSGAGGDGYILVEYVV